MFRIIAKIILLALATVLFLINWVLGYEIADRKDYCIARLYKMIVIAEFVLIAGLV